MTETTAVAKEHSITDMLFATNKQCVLGVARGFKNLDYTRALQKKNLTELSFNATMDLINGPEEVLVKRAYDRLSMAEAGITKFIGKSGDVLLPYSGGRDSTVMALLLSMMMQSKPTRKLDLITVLSGFTNGLGNPRTQYELVKRVTENGNVRHFYFDLSQLFGSNIVDSAADDLKRLGYPGLCSGCKINMEVAIAAVGENLYPGTEQFHIPMGYNDFQSSQQWPEQTKAQMDTIHTAINGRNGRAHIGAPIYDTTQLAIDAPLILALFGVENGFQKKEMKCVAAGTNPTVIDEAILADFASWKYEQTMDALQRISFGLIGLVSEELNAPALDLREKVLAFKLNPENMKEVYIKK